MKKRICFLVDSIFSIGGVQRVTAVISKALSDDADITILTFDKPDAKDTSLYGLNEAPLSFRFFEYPPISRIENTLCKAYSWTYLKLRPESKWTSDLYGYSSFPPTLRKALTRELQQGRYDIVIGVHAPLAARLATIKKDLQGVKTIGWIHNSFEALFSETSLYIGAARKRHYVYQFQKLDKTIVLYQHDAQSYHSYDSAFTPFYIYNPLTLQPGKVSDGHSRRFLAIGRFSHLHKGFDLLIEAFHLFAQSNNDWCLDIVGEGAEHDLYQSLIGKYHLEERVFIHPFTNNIQTYYSRAQVYVLSSRWEGMPLVLVEAMAHGLPIISSDIPTSQEIMGDFGIYFKNGDVNDLARKLEEATNIDWQPKSQQAIRIAHKFNIESIIARWKQILEI